MYMDADEMDFPTPDSDVDSIEPESLKARIDDGESVTLLDARMSSDYEWRIDGPNVESINVPYFQFLDEEIDDDVLARIPDDEHVTVLCAKGGASEYVAGALADRGYDVDHLEDGMNGWASIYETHEVTDYDGPGTLIQYQRPSSGCLGYLLYDDGGGCDRRPAACVHRPLPRRRRGTRRRADVRLRHTRTPTTISGLRNLADEGVEAMLPPPPPPTAASPTPTMSRSSRTATSSPWATRPSRPCSRPDTRPG